MINEIRTEEGREAVVPHPQTRAKYWCFTLNNYNQADIDRLSAPLGEVTEVTYIIFSKEASGGVVCFQSRKCMQEVIDVIGIAQTHCSITRSLIQTIGYCKKGNDFTEVGVTPLTSEEEARAARFYELDSDLDPDLEGVVDLVDEDGDVLASELTAEEKKKRPKLQHVALTLWDTDEIHRNELKRMQSHFKWCGVLEGREICPDTGKPHLHVYIQTHWTKRKRITDIRRWFTDETTDVTWPGGLWIGPVRDRLGYVKYCKKDGDFRSHGEIFTDSNRKGEERQDRHDLRNAIYEEGICDLKVLRRRFPNQMMHPGGERYARQLINDVTPVREPEKFEKEHLWQRELREKLRQPDNGREIITIHSMQTRQGKTKFMQHLKWEYNQKKDGSALTLTVAPAKDLIDTIKDYRHSLELLIIEIPKAKGDPAFLKGVFSLLELIKNGEAFASKYQTETVRFKNNVKIIICRNDLHKPDALYGKDREAYMDISVDTWEWVPHRVLEQRWNELHPNDSVIIDEGDYDKDGWYVEWHGKKKTDHGKWFRDRTIEKQIKEMEAEQERDVLNNVRRLSQLKRKYTELKVATWIYRRMKPASDEKENESEDEVFEQLVTDEEQAMAEQLRKINKDKGYALMKKHKRAVGMLKRKREQRSEDAAFEHNSKRHWNYIS